MTGAGQGEKDTGALPKTGGTTALGKGAKVQDKTYVITEIVGTSKESVSAAVNNAVERANKTLKALDWFEVKAVRGTVVDGSVGQYQVTLDVGFRYLSDEEMKAWAEG